MEYSRTGPERHRLGNDALPGAVVGSVASVARSAGVASVGAPLPAATAAVLGTMRDLPPLFDPFSLTAPQIAPEEAVRLARAERFELQAVARSILPSRHRIRCCLLYRQHNTDFVEIRRSQASGLAYYAGLQTCGLGAVCPVCGCKIAEHNAGEIQTALDIWKAYSGIPALFTYTMPHYRSQGLSENVVALLAAHRNLTRNRPYRRLCERAGLTHSIRAIEVTYGRRNGFHPHLHVLGFFGPGYTSSDVAETVPSIWLAELLRQQVEIANPADVLKHGVSVQLGFTAGAKYLSKVSRVWGLAEEIAKANRKKGRGDHYSPAQLLSLVRDGELWAADVYREYAEAAHGLHFLQWSRGMRAALGLADEKTDEDIAAGVKQSDAVLATLSAAEWCAVRARGWQARSRLVELADYDEDAALGYVAHLVEQFRRGCGELRN